uniref:Uncharacterized protein n=1 Tax=Musca domestica TaxID=7370 RepID=A0A1I8MXV1_MUSDO
MLTVVLTSLGALTSKMPVFRASSQMPAQSPRNVAITFSMSSVVNLKMFVYLVLILTNCLSGGASIGFASATSLSAPKSSVIGDITETHGKIIDSKVYEDNAEHSAHQAVVDSSSAATGTTQSSQPVVVATATAKDLLNPSPPPKLSVVDGGSLASPSAALGPTGSASSRFNVDLRDSKSIVGSTGAIQSPTTFIGEHRLHQLKQFGLRKKPQSLTAASSLSSTKSAFDEKSMSLEFDTKNTIIQISMV